MRFRKSLWLLFSEGVKIMSYGTNLNEVFNRANLEQELTAYNVPFENAFNEILLEQYLALKIIQWNSTSIKGTSNSFAVPDSFTWFREKAYIARDFISDSIIHHCEESPESFLYKVLHKNMSSRDLVKAPARCPIDYLVTRHLIAFKCHRYDTFSL